MFFRALISARPIPRTIPLVSGTLSTVSFGHALMLTCLFDLQRLAEHVLEQVEVDEIRQESRELLHTVDRLFTDMQDG